MEGEDQAAHMPQWDPNQCLTFAQERTQPAIDLVQRIPLSAPQATVISLDSSAEMIARALFSVVKLAIRMHASPRRVLQAYVSERYSGNLPDLFEPGHGPLFAPGLASR
jgi:hypothetical protein